MSCISGRACSGLGRLPMSCLKRCTLPYTPSRTTAEFAVCGNGGPRSRVAPSVPCAHSVRSHAVSSSQVALLRRGCTLSRTAERWTGIVTGVSPNGVSGSSPTIGNGGSAAALNDRLVIAQEQLNDWTASPAAESREVSEQMRGLEKQIMDTQRRIASSDDGAVGPATGVDVWA